MGLEPPKSSKLVTFHINLPKRVYPLKQFLQNLAWAWEKESQVRTHPHAKFYRFGFINVSLQPEKSLKLVIFGKYLPQRGYIPFINFYKIWRGEGLPSPHNHANFHLRGFKNVALRPPKSQKMQFLYKFSPKKPGGP